MLLFVLAWICTLAALLRRLADALSADRRRPGRYRRADPGPLAFRRRPKKPTWVKNEILRLKALMPHAGCRALSMVFNRRFTARRGVTVGKTFVSELMRKHRYEIQILRRRMTNARPNDVPHNLVWALDLTGKTTLDGSTHVVLGVLEHASRAALWLEALESKSSWVIVARLSAAIRRHGKPRIIRTDNEAVFTSRALCFALRLLGIRHQRTDPGCPWQNGRIERFFGTLKERLDRLAVDSRQALNGALAEFRFFYNHVRPHQSLSGCTPAEAWAGDHPPAGPASPEYWFSAWEGLLTGYYLRR